MINHKPGNSLRPFHRLKSGRQFQAVFAARQRLNISSLTIHFSQNNCSYDRLGLAVSKKVGGAVVRNRVKRLIREVFRTNRTSEPPWLDLVVRPQKQILDVSFSELVSIWKQAVSTAKERTKNRRK